MPKRNSRTSARMMGDPLSDTPATEVHTSADPKVPTTLGQAAWALMFVAIYMAVAAGALLALGLTGIIEFTLELFLPLLFASVTAAAFLALYIHLFRRNKLAPADLGFRRPTPRLFHLLWQIPVTIIACASLQGLSLALLPLLGVDTAPAATANDSLADIGRLPVSLAVIAVLVVAIFTPLWEETLFRGAFLDGLSKRFRPAAAITLSAAIFAAIHIVPLSFVYLFALGIALALLRRFHQNLWAPILLHAANNALVVLIAFIATQPRS